MLKNLQVQPAPPTHVKIRSDETDPPILERFELQPSEEAITRFVRTRTGSVIASEIHLPPDMDFSLDLAAAYDAAWLRSKDRPPLVEVRGEVRIVDLFCGCGALSLGVDEACRALGLRARHLLGVDMDPRILPIYSRNFPDAETRRNPIEEILDSGLRYPLSLTEKELQSRLGEVDLIIGGPPCQGNSNLNNHTRRNDPKNALYLKMARAAEVLQPHHIIIENVPGVVHETGQVVARTKDVLIGLGYNVDEIVVNTVTLGVPQRRRRHILVASRTRSLSLSAILKHHSKPDRTVRWACEDLIASHDSTVYNSPSSSTERNLERINYLFDNDLYDLPNELRPDCHRLKPHSYKSVYGRLKWDEPAPTVTSGFGSIGQGRFIHPAQRRTLTPHEAARLQFIPDFYDFSEVQRAALLVMIGNAVPPKLGYVLALELLG